MTGDYDICIYLKAPLTDLDLFGDFLTSSACLLLAYSLNSMSPAFPVSPASSGVIANENSLNVILPSGLSDILLIIAKILALVSGVSS